MTAQGRSQGLVVGSAPAQRVQVRRVHHIPEVKVERPSVEVDENPVLDDVGHRGHVDHLRLVGVGGLQLVANLPALGGGLGLDVGEPTEEELGGGLRLGD